jgi:hypothetical protein
MIQGSALLRLFLFSGGLFRGCYFCAFKKRKKIVFGSGSSGEEMSRLNQALLRPWMILNDRIFQIFFVKMGVNLCRNNGFMAQHFLNRSQVGTPVNQMGGK